MESVTDPWVAQYERLMAILGQADVPTINLMPRTQRKMLMIHRFRITNEEFREALVLFNTVFEGEM